MKENFVTGFLSFLFAVSIGILGGTCNLKAQDIDPSSLSPIPEDGFSLHLEQAGRTECTFRFQSKIPFRLEAKLSSQGQELRREVLELPAGELAYDLDGLIPGTPYQLEFKDLSGCGCKLDPNPFVFSTISNSSGEIKVFFTNSTNPGISYGSFPDGTTGVAFMNEVLDRIQAATQTIDFCAYNNDRPEIVNALKEAYNKGVRVRYITEAETSNSALQTFLPFTVVKGNDAGLMHNKFVVIDAASDEKAWVIMGSTNFTTNNIFVDDNNSLVIQDKALAQAYTLEFEEMWGSQTATPGSVKKFGSEKTDNTPHEFTINGKEVELYFSPSDNTTLQINNELSACQHDLSFCLLTFTMDVLANQMIYLKNQGVQVRGLIDNINDTGSEYTFLNNNGVKVLDHTFSEQLHHKYGIVDGYSSQDDPVVITGSHNWSFSAETKNDENTLIVHDAVIANLFLQEFEARWCAQTSNDCNLVNRTGEPQSATFQVYPNPAVSQVCIDSEERVLAFQVIGPDGRRIYGAVPGAGQGSVPCLSVSNLPSGSYWLRVETVSGYRVMPFQKI